MNLFNGNTPLLSLIGYHSVLDDILAKVFEGLVFDDSIFSVARFQDFVEFILSKNIKIEICLNNGVSHTDDLTVLKLLQFGCRKVKNCGWLKSVDALKYANELEYVDRLFVEISEVKKFPKNFIPQLSRLIDIELLISDVEDLNIIDYHDIAEDLKLWLCTRNGNSKKRLTIIFEVYYENCENNYVNFINWASQFIDFNKDGISEFRISIEWHASLFTFVPQLDFTCFFQKHLLDSLNLIFELMNNTELHNCIQRKEFSEPANQMQLDLTGSFNRKEPLVLKHETFFDNWLKNMTSLKELTFAYCELTCKLINHLPVTITKLSFERIQIDYDSDDSAVMLPQRLRNLRIEYDVYLNEPITIFKFCKIDELNELDNVNIAIHAYTNLTPMFHSQMKPLFFAFNRVLRVHYSKYNEDIFIDLKPLSFEGHACLEYFSLLTDLSPAHYDLLNLPPCLNADLTLSAETLTGRFPSCLESLVIKMRHYKQPFDVFWKQFISPLKNLVVFRAFLWVDEEVEIDFRKFKFPPHMHTIELSIYASMQGSATYKLIFNQLPNSFIHFKVWFGKRLLSANKCCIIVEENDGGLSLSSIKRVLNVGPPDSVEWIARTNSEFS
ncbi:unnamed protein product [Ambrosiozyma monospora]|uniref:Unnamed protein product n=1 Tax=Ambrosiozyma monospora TaxID=43982 RepID=A0A9W6Z181_AMBMO|nr:unnamed protein product [Ambrosiozyma monospora]